MMYIKFLSLVFVGLFTISCTKSYLKEVLAENPDILVEAIEKNPKEIINALNNASIKFRQEQIAQASKKRRVEREKEFSAPKKPTTPSHRAYFGDVKAPITIVEYSDFQCFYCKAVHDETLGRVLKAYKGKVRILYKHLPIQAIHPQALLAAQYYEAVVKLNKGKAKKFHDKLFANQSQLRQGGKFLDKIVREVGLSPKRVKAKLNQVKPIIEADQKEARKFGFSGTPGFLVGGVSLRGKNPFSEFKKIIDRLLKDMNK